MITQTEYKEHKIEFDDTTHTYFVDGIKTPSVTTIIKEILPSMYDGVPKRILEKASIFGTKLHKATEIDSDEGLDYYEKLAFDEYNKLLEKENIVPLEQEVFVCYDNPNYPDNGLPKVLFVGQTDMIGLVNDKKCLLDKKFTSKYHEDYLNWQLSMYELACYDKFEKLLCIHVPKKGIGHLYESERISQEKIMSELEKYYLKNKKKKTERKDKKMGKCIPVLIMGESGSGKSTSMRNFSEKEIGIVNVLNKPLPFKNSLKMVCTDDYEEVKQIIAKAKAKTIVIDDSNYLITNEFMRNSKDTGFQKYNDIGFHFWDLINYVKELDGNKIVYFFMHSDTTEDGKVIPKTIGKMLNEKVNIAGMFTIVLRAMYDNGRYVFKTKTNGYDVCKTPIDMFDEEIIDNDLKLVDTTIRKYYDLEENK